MFFKRIVGIVLATSFLMACSNDDDDSKGQGSIGFLHTVADAAQIRVEDSNRYYGTYFYESMGAPIILTEGGYGVDVVEQDLQNSARNEVLTSSSFNVSSNRIRLSVMHGRKSDNSVAATTFALAWDSDAGSNNNDDTRYLNVSNAFVGADSVTVTFHDVLSGDATDKTETLIFGATSTTFEFDSSAVYLKVVDTAGVELYKSESKVIEDQKEQTLVIANYAGLTSESMTAYYYGTVYRAAWDNQSLAVSGDGYVKVSNALLEKTGDDITYPLSLDYRLFLQNEDGTETDVTNTGPTAITVNYGASSEYDVAYAPGNYVLKIEGVANWGYGFSVAHDSAVNLSLYGFDLGNGPESAPAKVNDDKRALNDFATIQFQHLAVQKMTDEAPLVLDVHIVPAGQLPNSSTLMIASLYAGGSTSFAVNLVSSSYTMYLTKSGVTSSWVTNMPLSLVNGESGLFFVYNAGSGTTGTGIEVVDATKDITPTP